MTRSGSAPREINRVQFVESERESDAFATLEFAYRNCNLTDHLQREKLVRIIREAVYSEINLSEVRGTIMR